MRQIFFISTKPKGQGRARFTTRGKFAVAYDPAASRDYKADIKYQILKQDPQMMEGGISLVVEFLIQRPKSHYNSKGEVKGNAPLWHTGRPDLDNMVKAVMDAISTTGKIWKDDSQVCSTYQGKKWGDPPGIQIILEEIKQP